MSLPKDKRYKLLDGEPGFETGNVYSKGTTTSSLLFLD